MPVTEGTTNYPQDAAGQKGLGPYDGTNFWLWRGDSHGHAGIVIFDSAGNSITSTALSGDGLGSANIGLFAAAAGLVFNGTTWDRIKGANGYPGHILYDAAGNPIDDGQINVDGIAATKRALFAQTAPLVWNGTTWDRLKGTGGHPGAIIYDAAGNAITSTALSADALSASNIGLFAASAGLAYNGASWDRFYANQHLVGLTSQARTLSAQTPNLTNNNSRGAIAILDCSAASGTGGLSMMWYAYDPQTGHSQLLNSTPASPIIATGTYLSVCYPGIGTNNTNPGIRSICPMPLPRTFFVLISVGDATSYTYSLSVELIN